MAKHRVQWSLRTYHRRIKEGRGQGTLGEYKPLCVRIVVSEESKLLW